MKRAIVFAGSMALVFFAFAGNGKAEESIPHCPDVKGCITVGWDLGSQQCLYNCGAT